MYKTEASKRFRKDLKKIQNDPRKRIKLKKVMIDLSQGVALGVRHRDHSLNGKWHSCRDCHVLPDLVLIYKKDETHKCIRFERVGTHSELFE